VYLSVLLDDGERQGAARRIAYRVIMTRPLRQSSAPSSRGRRSVAAASLLDAFGRADKLTRDGRRSSNPKQRRTESSRGSPAFRRSAAAPGVPSVRRAVARNPRQTPVLRVPHDLRNVLRRRTGGV